MNEYIVIRTVVRLLAPFIFMYGLYVQLHGEYSPGGGFQAGVICASAFIAYGLVNGLKELKQSFSFFTVKLLCCLGLLLYLSVGIITMAKGGGFLDYGVLHSNRLIGQQIGIMIIELGVGITVFSVMMLIFYVFGERSS